MRIVSLAAKKSISTIATLTVLAVVSTATEVQAAARPRIQKAEPPQPVFSRPVIAVVSVKDQRVSFYDADGTAIRSRVSSGQAGLETPSGVYSVLQKEAEHYSNVYDDAAMPFMQRITWSGIALHAGALPGYPASHGCVRMAYQFARQVFPLTHLGMRVVVSPDDFAPVPISHPMLLQPSPPDTPIASSASFSSDDGKGRGYSPFQADVSKWPARAAQMDMLRASAAERAAKADAAIARAAELKKDFDKRQLEQAKAQKARYVATLAKRAADDQLARAERNLTVAKLPRSTKSEGDAKAKALLQSQRASEAITKAREKLAAAERDLAAATDSLAQEKPRSAEASALKREVNKKKSERVAANKALSSAVAAKRSANERLASAEKSLYLASIPRSTKFEESARAKALSVASDLGAKAAAAATSAQLADEQFASAERELKSAEATRDDAIAASSRVMRWTLPVSMFVSLKSQHLYVRQGHEAIFDMPLSITDPKRPIGTHVYTAVGFGSGGNSMLWTAVKVGRNAAGNVGRNRWASLDAQAPHTDLTDATAPLDRITLPDEALKRIAGYVWPGSSIIVSDEEMSKETGKATDFIVLMSGEPQGGLKSRPKAGPQSYRRRYYSDDDDYYDRRYRRQKETSSFFFW
jgi:hypothetical protein